MTNAEKQQQVFDVFENAIYLLEKQGTYCHDKLGAWTCEYRDREGNKCIIGQLIPDKLRKGMGDILGNNMVRRWDRNTVVSVCNHNKIVDPWCMGMFQTIAMALQKAHDECVSTKPFEECCDILRTQLEAFRG